MRDRPASIDARHDADALIIARQTQPDLIVCDLLMPVMDRRHLIMTIRKLHPPMKIIASSGMVEKMKMMSGNENSAAAFIDKPYTAETMMTTIATVLKG